MKSIEEIRNDVKERETLMVNVLSLYRDFEFLATPKSADLIKFFSKNPIFIRSKRSFFNSLCIEVQKLFSNSKNDDFRFNKIMDEIRDFRSAQPDFLSDKIVEELTGLLNTAMQNESLEPLKIIRDKYLSHTDKDRDQFLVSVNTKSFNELVCISTKIIDILRLEILNEKTTIQAYLQEDGYAELEGLSKLI